MPDLPANPITSSRVRWFQAIITGFIVAVLAGISWAFFISKTKIIYGYPSILIGFLVGFCVLFVGRSRPVRKSQQLLYYSIGPASTLVGIATGKLLDFKWRILPQFGEESHPTSVIDSATLNYDLFFFLAASYFSFRIPSSRMWQSLVAKNDYISNEPDLS